MFPQYFNKTYIIKRIYEGWDYVMANIFFGKIDISWRNMEIYKWKWMVLVALGCIDNAKFEKNIVNNNIVLDVRLCFK